MKLATTLKGRFANFFRTRGEVAPDDLIEALEREVAKSKNSQNVVPNSYTIYLCEEDCYRLSAARMIRDLYEAVEREVIRENCFMDGTLSIRIEKFFDSENALVVKSKFVADTELEQDTIDLASDVLSRTLIRNGGTSDGEATIVADHTKIVRTMRTSPARKIEYNLAVITDFTTTEVVFGERQIYLGRKDTNDFVVNDESASRIHAYISYERHRHILHDAGSLNGTFVNKKPISSCELKDGDKILIGNTLLAYKVL
ncbi:MAG: DUF3662 domain-containing protein [Selenomonadaceae bacterium]|nr:DUF3662 domain-containing protein [Selenomonadaceae bacterium]